MVVKINGIFSAIFTQQIDGNHVLQQRGFRIKKEKIQYPIVCKIVFGVSLLVYQFSGDVVNCGNQPCVFCIFHVSYHRWFWDFYTGRRHNIRQPGKWYRLFYTFGNLLEQHFQGKSVFNGMTGGNVSQIYLLIYTWQIVPLRAQSCPFRKSSMMKIVIKSP